MSVCQCVCLSASVTRWTRLQRNKSALLISPSISVPRFRSLFRSPSMAIRLRGLAGPSLSFSFSRLFRRSTVALSAVRWVLALLRLAAFPSNESLRLVPADSFTFTRLEALPREEIAIKSFYWHSSTLLQHTGCCWWWCTVLRIAKAGRQRGNEAGASRTDIVKCCCWRWPGRARLSREETRSSELFTATSATRLSSKLPQQWQSPY